MPALLALAALVAGCAAESARGHARPADGGLVVSSSAAEDTPRQAEPALADLRPCELLGPVDRSTVGLTELGTEKTVGDAPACDWTEPGVFGLLVSVDAGTGLAGIDPGSGTTEEVELGAHKALLVADRAADDGTCALLIGVGDPAEDSATVQIDVSNTDFTDTDSACRRARIAGELIEPKLP
ncbi:uncharacterized protein DUF3558 [Amycolatopsis cihanbeyliensis]|uniref:Uncharacterized protein DUF3558 n=1 Tax=Amycolatopsis cihanbeyliensis TaxID=1128664 RepID=A0A542CT76_AMYCI|nr:uncharacterized protein DUF3558 [Amycolatopsis cihanbeyliensis]